MDESRGVHVLVVVDMEGATGIHSYQQAYSLYDEYWQQGRGLLTGDVNAAVRGLFRGGAAQVSVLDNHGGEKDVMPERFDSRANLLPKPMVRPTAQGVWPALLDQLRSPPNAIALVGYHAMAATSRAYMPHTINPEFDVSINSQSIGEIGLNIGRAGEQGVPAILITGDDAACAEGQLMLPNIAAAMTKLALTLRVDSEMQSSLELPGARECYLATLEAGLARWLQG